MHVHFAGRDFAGAALAAVAAMDEAGIRAAVVMPPPMTAEVRAPYDVAELRPALAAHPGRFAFLGGGGSLNVLLHQDGDRGSFERIARDILEAGAAGFGEISPHHLSMQRGHPYEWVVPDHPLLRLLADIAAEKGAVIDLHLDVVPQDMKTPARFDSPHNPPLLKENLAAFERLLAHNRKARIVWAHAGSDPLGHRTPALSRGLLERHPNLHMSLRFPARQGTFDEAWLRLVEAFPDRFVIGGDQFIAAPGVAGEGPGLAFAKLAPVQRELARRFLAALPPDVTRQVGIDNALRLYFR